MGPGTGPCGIPLVISIHSDITPFTRTRCRIPVKTILSILTIFQLYQVLEVWVKDVDEELNRMPCKQHRMPHLFLAFQSIPLCILKAGSCSLFLAQIRVEHLKRGRLSCVQESSLLRFFPSTCILLKWDLLVGNCLVCYWPLSCE